MKRRRHKDCGLRLVGEKKDGGCVIQLVRRDRSPVHKQDRWKRRFTNHFDGRHVFRPLVKP